MAISFISSKDNDEDEESVMHSKRDNIEIMINDKADELFKPLLNRYLNNLERLHCGKSVQIRTFFWSVFS